MNEEIINQINAVLRNTGYDGVVTTTDSTGGVITISELSTTPLAEPPTTPPTEPPSTLPTEPPSTQPAEPPITPPTEPPTLESIIEQQNARIEQQNARIEALTNKLNEIFKISPNVQPKNEWESYLDNPGSATYRAMKEAGLIKENNNA